MFYPWVEAVLGVAAICVGLIPSIWKEGEPWDDRNEFFGERRRRSIVSNKQDTVKGRMIEFCYRFTKWFTDKRLYLIAAFLAILVVLLQLSP
jgi:hypothetical protein